MSRAQQPGEPLAAHDQEVLDFETERDARSTSWERADPRAALLERWGRYGFLVMLPGGSR